MTKINADMHIHSIHSFDGTDTMYDICESAIARRLKHVCFTEHYDCDPESRSYGHFSLGEFERDVDSCQEKFGNSLEILKGIEFGEPHEYLDELERVQLYDLDVILGAVHRIKGVPIPKLVARGVEPVELLLGYYKEISSAVSTGGFDVLAHFDFPKRYLGFGYYVPDITTSIFETMLREKMALEINTSTYGIMGECCPDQEIVNSWIAAGGTQVVVGSDAHDSQSVAGHFGQAERIVSQNQSVVCGLFRNRQFYMLP